MKRLILIMIPLLIAVFALTTIAVWLINAGSDRSSVGGRAGHQAENDGGSTSILGRIFKPEVSLLGPNDEQLEQGQSYDITWDARHLDNVKVIAIGHHTSFNGNNRGDFNMVIADKVPADQGKVNWTVPFIDAMRFRIYVKGYDEDRKEVASQDKVYLFRPDIFRTRHDDGIYIDVRNETRQRLYVFKGGKLTRVYLTSGSRANEYMPRNVHPQKAHDHDGVFKVEEKYDMWHSKMFDVPMPWAMRYWSGHFIHGTDPDEYDRLGTPASSGCNRLNQEQAKDLYDMTPIGTRVEIIAK